MGVFPWEANARFIVLEKIEGYYGLGDTGVIVVPGLRHCERSEAIGDRTLNNGLLRCARNDVSQGRDDNDTRDDNDGSGGNAVEWKRQKPKFTR